MKQPYNGSLIGLLRRMPWITRLVALTVALALLSLVGMPTVVAARAAERQADIRASLEPSSARELSQRLEQAREQLQSLRATMEQEEGKEDRAAIAARVEALQSTRERLMVLRDETLDRFEVVAERLEAGNVSDKIHQRHRHARDRFTQKMDRLLGHLEQVQRGGKGRLQAAIQGLNQLEKHRAGKPQHPFDPNRLPARGLRKKAGENKPKTDRDEFTEAGLHNTPRPRLASHGTFRLDELAGASDPAWRAESPEVTLTHPIVDKAAELNHDPVAIHEWVRNNVQWIPAWGAMQSAEHTLSSRRGNAMDIAGLEIALLRASDIPARYVHGTIEVDEARFRNWAGGYDSIEAAADYAASGGVPITTIVEAGRIARIQMEHVWVEAAVDYFPSRAAVNRSADAWIPLDPSFKQYDFIEGIDVAAVTGTDPQALAQSFLDSGTVNEAEGWVSGFDPTILQNAENDAETALADYIENDLPDDATVADVLGGRRIIEQDYTTLPASIPNRLTVVGARYDELPNQLRNRLALSFGVDIFGQPRNPVRFPWATVNGQRLTLSFSPATQEDEEALLALLPEEEITDPSQLPQSIPSHLVEVVPEIRLDGEVVHTGVRMQLGEEIDFNFTVSHRGYGDDTRVSPVIAGSYLALTIAGGSVSRDSLEGLQARVQTTKDKLESQDPNQIASLTREELLGDLFHAGSLAYFGQFDALATLQARQQQANQNLAPSAGTYGYEPRVSFFFGLPQAIEHGGVVMDLDRVAWIHGAQEPSPDKARQLNVQAGALSSALEHGVPEQMFTTESDPAEAVSAVKALAIANQEGQRIYRITQVNQNEVLPNINHDANTMSEIRDALAAGKEVTTHRDPVSVPGWQGAGYVILDSEGGDGAWKIGGGSNGSWIKDHANELGALSIFGSLIALLLTPAAAAIVAGLALVLALVVVQVKIAFAAQDLPGPCQGLLWLYGGLSIVFGLFGLSKAVNIAAIAAGIWSFLIDGTFDSTKDLCADMADL